MWMRWVSPMLGCWIAVAFIGCLAGVDTDEPPSEHTAEIDEPVEEGGGGLETADAGAETKTCKSNNGGASCSVSCTSGTPKCQSGSINCKAWCDGNGAAGTSSCTTTAQDGKSEGKVEDCTKTATCISDTHRADARCPGT